MHRKGAAEGGSSTHAWHGGLHHTGRHEVGHADEDFRAIAQMQKEKQKDDPPTSLRGGHLTIQAKERISIHAAGI